MIMTGCDSTTPPTTETYLITASAGPNGSITPSGDIEVYQGEDQTFIITPDSGYQVESILIDGAPVTATGEYTFSAVDQDHTITVSFTEESTQTGGPVHNITQGTYYNTIQAALDEAINNDTIEVDDGTYEECLYYPSDMNLVLRSVNGAAVTTIKGNNTYATVHITSPLAGSSLSGFTVTHQTGKSGWGVYIQDGQMTIDQCIITGNESSYNGGGIRNICSTLTVTDTTISDNSADSGVGGGVTNYDSNLTLTDCTLTGNSAQQGGGICNVYNSNMIINNCTITDNVCNLFGGGGIHCVNDAILNVTNSTISTNTVEGFGGGISIHDAVMTIANCTLSDNVSHSDGGGICIYNDGSSTIMDCTISGNHADDSGGAIANKNCQLALTGSTISDNSATHGGGIMLWLDTSSGPYPTIGGLGADEENIICGNYKGTDAASTNQAIRSYYYGNLYDQYARKNNITANCPF